MAQQQETAEEESSGNVPLKSTFDPIIVNLIRKQMPNLIAYDLCGVQPMSGPTGLIFALRHKHEPNGNVFYRKVPPHELR